MSDRKRVAIGGFQHETNTFGSSLATFEEFEKHDGWPGLTEGADLFEQVRAKNLPITGFIEAAGNGPCELEPLLWCSAEPSSYVTDEAFERVTSMLCDRLRALGPVDAVYLDLHGAMVTESYEDGDGEVLRRVREVIGTKRPLVASLDFHANITAEMVELASSLCVYRTYPHLDMADTGARTHRLLSRLLDGEPLHNAFRKLPFLIPLPAQGTDFEPSRSLFRTLRGLESGAAASLDFAEGFPAADIRECGPAIVAYDRDRAAADAAADEMMRAVLEAEPTFENELVPPDEAVRTAMRVDSDRPVVLADAQDNPGAGASSDTVGLLEALVRNGAKGAVLAIVNDPEVAALAHAAGSGARIDARLGGKSGQPGQAPFTGSFEVERLADGRFTCSGEMYRGTCTELGPMVLLRIDSPGCDVRVIVGSKRFQCLDLAIFRHLGVEPTAQRILAVKSTVHFRADFDPIASLTLVVESPGENLCRLAAIPYRRLREGVRLEPMGPSFRGQPASPRRVRG